MQDFAGNVGSPVRNQKRHGLGHVLWASEPTERSRFAPHIPAGFGHNLVCTRRWGGTRGDRIDPNAARRQFDGELASQGSHPPFDCGIDRRASVPPIGHG